VNFVINYDKKNHFKFAPLISSYARIQLEKFNISHLEFDTFILIDAADYFIKSDAALRVVKYFDHPSNI
jgi:predicted DCC family thiol-disulfide oxidoreductase YuxK